MTVPEKIVSLLQQLVDDVAADVTPDGFFKDDDTTILVAKLASSTVESPPGGETPKIAKRRRSINPAIKAGLKAGAAVTIAPDGTVIINAPAAPKTSSDVLNADDELARWRQKKNAR